VEIGILGALEVRAASKIRPLGGTKQRAVLAVLLINRNRAVSTESLIDAVWDGAFDGDPNIVDVYVSRLRDKIDRPFGRSTLQTVRGVGYRLQDDAPDLA